MKIRDRKKLIISVVLLLPIIAFLVWFIIQFSISYYHISKGHIKYKGKWYTEETLPKEARGEWTEYRMKLKSTPTKRTPEETYNLFRQAIIEKRYEDALQYILPEKRGKYEDLIKKIDQKNLAVKIEKEEEYGAYKIYVYDVGDGFGHTIIFKKDLSGYWYIEEIGI